MEQFTNMEMKLISLTTIKQVSLKDREFRKLCNKDYDPHHMVYVIAKAWPELASFVETLPDAEFPQHGFGYTLPEHRIVNALADKLAGIIPYMILKKVFGGTSFVDNMYKFAQDFITILNWTID